MEPLWAIRSFEGVGPLRFSHTRSEVKAIVGAEPQSFRKTAGKPLTDAYDQHGFHAYFDDADVLTFLEFFPPAHASFRGQRFLGRPFSEVAPIFRAWDADVHVDEAGLVSCALGVTIYVEDVVAAVGAFRADQIDAYKATF